MLFVDLRKAYDSIPRDAPCLVLQKYGIPLVLVNLVKSLRDGMESEVVVNGGVTDNFFVQNDLRQQCTLAPTLNLYFNLVILEWRKRCQDLGVEILYKCSGKLVGERTRNLSKLVVTELLFAYDAAVVSTTRAGIEEAAHILDKVTEEWGLKMSIHKTKLLVAGVKLEDEWESMPIIIKDTSC